MLARPSHVTALGALGTLFAGGVTLRSYIAPATEPGIFSCVGFKVFGYSPCPYGLTLFFLITLLAALMWKIPNLYPRLRTPLLVLAIVGVLFSGWVAWREIGLPAVTLGNVFWQSFSLAKVPACAWGFVVFVLTLGLVCKLPTANPKSSLS